jgi:hypothetical protein
MARRGAGRSGVFAAVLGIGTALPVFYVAASGPLVALADRGDLPRQVELSLDELYRPIASLCKTTPLDGPLDRYNEMCGGLLPATNSSSTDSVFTSELEIPFPAVAWRDWRVGYISGARYYDDRPPSITSK